MTYISQQSGHELTEVSCRVIFTTDDITEIDLGGTYISTDGNVFTLVSAVQVAPGLTQIIMQEVL